jgi:4-alpha-glucanotransferase
VSALAALAGAAGLVPVYADQTGRRHEAPDETLRAALAAMGLPAATEAEAAEALAALEAARAARALPEWAVVEAGRRHALAAAAEGAWTLALEGGGEAGGRAEGGRVELPPLPAGRHRLSLAGAACWLLAAPPRLPPPPRAWGVTVPLYGLPPEAAGGGLATYADLAEWAAALGRAGAAFVGINPVHAGFPEDPAAFSPYAPSHRRRFATRHVAAGEPTEPPAPFVDYAAAWTARKAALEAAFAAGGACDPAFAAWRAGEGPALETFALHQAISERFGPYWSDWPAALRRPDGAEARAFACDHARRLAFHAWLQFRAEAGLAEAQRAARGAGMALGLYLDLAVGTHPAGAETWAEPQLFARGISLGAPPDAFAPQGQTWGVVPFSPPALVADGFAAFAETLARQLRFAGMLRIDHILGFERAFWVPEAGGLPGLYVRMPRDALLAVARIEAARAGAVLVGEDLGNIPEGFQAALADSGILGCRVAMFERDWATGAFRDSADWDAEVLASFATHDLPTWKGWREGRDIDWRHRLDRSADSLAERRARAEEVARMDQAIGGAVGDVAALHRFLGRSAARLVALQIEDILGLEEQANLPGTVHEHPNWRRRLPAGAAALAADPRLAEAAAIMKSCGREGGRP